MAKQATARADQQPLHSGRQKDSSASDAQEGACVRVRLVRLRMRCLLRGGRVLLLIRVSSCWHLWGPWSTYTPDDVALYALLLRAVSGQVLINTTIA